MSRSAGTTQRVVTCKWCGESVTAKCFLRHARGDCDKAPKENEDSKICSMCQELTPRVNFSANSYSPDGRQTACKSCNLERFHRWRDGHPTKAYAAHTLGTPRPKRWVLRPCPYCGVQYSYNALVAHKPRCDKRPPGRNDHQIISGVKVPANTAEFQAAYFSVERAKNASLKFNYGIDMLEWRDILDAQGGVCAICKCPSRGGTSKRSRGLHVDHNHKTGKVRGLLCHFCNIGLGHFNEDPVLMQSAIDYLMRHSASSSAP